ncbi:MAG: cyclophilin-like fold protein [Bacteroides uniformis]
MTDTAYFCIIINNPKDNYKINRKMNMKKLLLISMMLMTVLAMAACEDSGDEPFTPEHPELSGPSGGEDENESEVPDVSSLQVNIMVSNRTITATMEDNAATQDFLARLPLEVTLNDYNNTTEKIFYPSPALAIEGVTRGCAPIAGDITIYAPWGNVAIFCKNGSYSDTLIKIGRVDGDGIEMLSVPGDILVRFERR